MNCLAFLTNLLIFKYLDNTSGVPLISFSVLKKEHLGANENCLD